MSKLLSWKEVQPLVGGMHYTTWWRMIQKGEAPAGRKTTARSVRWDEDEIKAHVANRPKQAVAA